MVTKRAFWNDMNRHRQTDYRCVAETYIVECSRADAQLPTVPHLTVWRHQDDGAADPELGEVPYSHDWISVASALGTREEIDQLYRELTTEAAILELRDSEENFNRKQVPA